MGSTAVVRPRGRSDRDFFQALLAPGHEITACATVLDPIHDYFTHVFVAAVRDASTELVSPHAWLTGRHDGMYHYKAIPASDGPFATPPRVLDALTPTTDPALADWVAACRDRAARTRNSSPNPGDLVRFATPINFTDGSRVQDFIVAPGRRLLTSTDGARRFDIPLWRHRDDYTLTTPQA